MARPIYLFLFIVMSAYATNAQDFEPSKRHVEMRQVLGMTKHQYQAYNTGIKKYDRKIKTVLDNRTLDRHARGLAMEKLLRERKSYVQQHLCKEQRLKLEEYNRKTMPSSAKAKQQREQEERLAKNGMKVAAKESEIKKF